MRYPKLNSYCVLNGFFRQYTDPIFNIFNMLAILLSYNRKNLFPNPSIKMPFLLGQKEL